MALIPALTRDLLSLSAAKSASEARNIECTADLPTFLVRLGSGEITKHDLTRSMYSEMNSKYFCNLAQAADDFVTQNPNHPDIQLLTLGSLILFQFYCKLSTEYKSGGILEG